jgi:hypothetical protein
VQVHFDLISYERFLSLLLNRLFEAGEVLSAIAAENGAMDLEKSLFPHKS